MRGEELQDRYAGRREDAAGKVVLNVEHPGELGLIDERQAKNGASLAVTDIRILGKHRLGRGVVENDALSGAEDIAEHQLRQDGFSYFPSLRPTVTLSPAVVAFASIRCSVPRGRINEPLGARLLSPHPS